MKILHLSDTHYSFNSETDFDEFFLEPLCNDINKLQKDSPIDLVVITGDLIDKGGHGDIDLAYISFEDKLIKILDKININKDKVVFTPGNHDIDRNLVQDYVHDGLVTKLNNMADIDFFISENENKISSGIETIIPYKNFEKQFYEGNKNLVDISNFDVSFIFNCDGKKIGLSCLNSSWLCYNADDFGKILVGEKQIINSLNKIKEAEVKIAVMHHHFDHLSAIVKKNIEKTIRREYNFILFGHDHQADSFLKSALSSSLFVSVAPGTMNSNLKSVNINNLNGYAVIDFDIPLTKISIHHRRYSSAKNEYIANNDLGDDNGVDTITMPLSDKLKQIEERRQLIERTREVNIQKIDEKLFTRNNHTEAPKKLEELFVAPNIYEETTDKENRLVKNYTDVESLWNKRTSYIIFGTQECGKTTLLDKIILDVTSHNSDLIPVYIDFAKFNNDRLETAISAFLNESILRIEDLITNNNILLLIDNINFSGSEKLNKIKKFLESYKDVQVIATSNNNVSGEIPVEYFDLNESLLNKFTILKIGAFKTKQIKELVHKWFGGNTTLESNEKMNRIIDVFTVLGLPSNPLLISIFLWVLEQQSSFEPTNQATIFEIFIEKLFEKHSEDEALSSKFDFQNKIRLLASIAHEMYNNRHDNYSMFKGDLLEYIKNYMKAKKFDFISNDILEYFLEVGILSLDESSGSKAIKFKYSCYLEYFLMKEMNFNEEFKDYVLKKENYLCFINEIDLYTALKRDQEKILVELLDRMDAIFQPLYDDLLANSINIDSEFESVFFLTGSFENGFARKIKNNSKEIDETRDAERDKVLTKISSSTNIELKNNLESRQEFDAVWVLAAKVLKNSEEITKEGFKNLAYKKILKASVAYLFLYKEYLINSIIRKKDNITDESLIRNFFILQFLPLFHQMFLSQTLRTNKLNIVIEEVLNESEKHSDIEEFLSIFILEDLNKNADIKKRIQRLISKSKYKYLLFNSLVKLTIYYYLTNSKIQEGTYENLMTDIQEKMNGNSEKKYKGARSGDGGRNYKGKAIARIRREKLLGSFDNSRKEA